MCSRRTTITNYQLIIVAIFSNFFILPPFDFAVSQMLLQYFGTNSNLQSLFSVLQ